MEFKHTEVFNFKGAFRGMRNPLESWSKSDSYYERGGCFQIGANDLALAQKLIKAGPEHRKFMRQIIISVDITAPLYWWKEFDTYKVGITANSTSTMHKLHSIPITQECFELSKHTKNDSQFLSFIAHLEKLRIDFIETRDGSIWKTLIQELPSSWLQTRTVMMSYENILAIVQQRENHKLTEWSEDFMNWSKELPKAKELIFVG